MRIFKNKNGKDSLLSQQHNTNVDTEIVGYKSDIIERYDSFKLY